MSFSASDPCALVAVQRVDVEPVVQVAARGPCAERVVCLIAYVPPARSGRSLNQHTIASMSWVTVGTLFGRQIMSPRLMSMSSARRTLTDIGGIASSIGPPYSVDAGDRGGEARTAAP